MCRQSIRYPADQFITALVTVGVVHIFKAIHIVQCQQHMKSMGCVQSFQFFHIGSTVQQVGQTVAISQAAEQLHANTFLIVGHEAQGNLDCFHDQEHKYTDPCEEAGLGSTAEP